MDVFAGEGRRDGSGGAVPEWSPGLGARFMKAWNHDRAIIDRYGKPFRDDSVLASRTLRLAVCIALALLADACIVDRVLGRPHAVSLLWLPAVAVASAVVFDVLARRLVRCMTLQGYGEWFYGMLTGRARLNMTRMCAYKCLESPYRYHQCDHPLGRLNGMFFDLVPYWMTLEPIVDWLNPYLVKAERDGRMDGRVVMVMGALLSAPSERPSDEDVRGMGKRSGSSAGSSATRPSPRPPPRGWPTVWI